MERKSSQDVLPKQLFVQFNALKGGVMVVGEIIFAARGGVTCVALASDDPLGATVAGVGRFDRVFAVVTALLFGQSGLAIAKGAAVFVGIRKWAALLNQLQRFLPFFWQIAVLDCCDGGLPCITILFGLRGE